MNVFLATADIHEIAPPVDYSLVPPWVIYTAVGLGLVILGLVSWWLWKRAQRPEPIRSPRDRTLDALHRIGDQMETQSPYQFSIAVSDILRGYVTEQYQLPVTRQTSVEFLAMLAKSSPFSPEEASLLQDFLERCDLIKFARYDATPDDSRRLLEEAIQFVKGAKLEPV
ncbi:MAG: DUF4381 domain-containing protein [Verrucomicrobiota bacterium]|nr:DUF4381 domain-containing protein [Verrucomicrobiota bacterium]